MPRGAFALCSLLFYYLSTLQCEYKSFSYRNLLGTDISMMGLTRLPGVARYCRLAGFIYIGEQLENSQRCRFLHSSSNAKQLLLTCRKMLRVSKGFINM